jgi:hypothetical protein
VVRSPTRAEDVPLVSASISALGPTQPPVQWVPRALSPGVKERLGRGGDHSPPSSAEVKITPSATSACGGIASQLTFVLLVSYRRGHVTASCAYFNIRPWSLINYGLSKIFREWVVLQSRERRARAKSLQAQCWAAYGYLFRSNSGSTTPVAVWMNIDLSRTCISIINKWTQRRMRCGKSHY